MTSEFYAHKKNSGNTIEYQTLADHLNGVNELVSEFVKNTNLKQSASLLALAHDAGKFNPKWQQWFMTETGEHPAHSPKGFEFLKNKMPLYLPYIIAKHHGRLEQLFNYESEDSGEFNDVIFEECSKFVSKELENSANAEFIAECTRAMSAFNKEGKELAGKRIIAHAVRYLYSCLVDADWLDSERFCNPEQFSMRMSQYDSMQDLLCRYNEYVSKRFSNPTTEINILRNDFRHLCENAGKRETGIYSVLAPCGIGKTISSLGWALNHAVANKKERIIIVIPFNSILTQTAKDVCDIVGANNVLVHYSDNLTFAKNHNYSPADIEKLKLNTENWNAPVVITSNVQFLETMFANNKQRLRKLHSYANSVVVFDEVQSGFPVSEINPLTNAIKTYNILFNMSALLMSATLPDFNKEYSYSRQSDIFYGMENICPVLTKAQQDMFIDKFKKVAIMRLKQNYTCETIVAELAKYDDVLCVVSFRKLALNIYTAMKKMCPDKAIFHLSKNMTSFDVDRVIAEIKARKANGEKICVISTQLIEAGVDLDFPVVFRQEAGVDSVIQSAGRCNRNGKIKEGQTFVFALTDSPKVQGDMLVSLNAYRNTTIFHNDWFCEDTIKDFYANKFAEQSRGGGFDVANIEGTSNDKRTISGNLSHLNFNDMQLRMIDDNNATVIVLNEYTKPIIRKFNATSFLNKNEWTILHNHSVSVNTFSFEKKFMQFCSPLTQGSNCYLLSEAYSNHYSPEIGLIETIDNEADSNDDVFIL